MQCMKLESLFELSMGKDEASAGYAFMVWLEKWKKDDYQDQSLKPHLLPPSKCIRGPLQILLLLRPSEFLAVRSNGSLGHVCSTLRYLILIPVGRLYRTIQYHHVVHLRQVLTLPVPIVGT